MKFKKATLVTYFGCTAAPGDSCGAPFRAGLPFDVLPASCAQSHLGGLETVGRHRSLGDWQRGGCAMGQNRSANDGAEERRPSYGDLRHEIRDQSVDSGEELTYRNRDNGGPSSSALSLCGARGIVCRF